MKKYHVSFMLIFSTEVDAGSPEEAVNVAEREVPSSCDIDGPACVTDLETDEQFEV